MRRLFVLSLGFEEKFAIRMITRHGLDHGDKLLVVTGPRIERVEKTLSFLREFITKYYGEGITLEVIELDVTQGFLSLIKKLTHILPEYAKDYDLVIINLSGGMRAICLALLTALILVSKIIGPKMRIELETEDSRMRIEVPERLLTLPWLVSTIGYEKTAVLKLISERALPVSAISEALGKDPSTIRRHLMELTRVGLAIARGPRPTRYEATPLGNLTLELLLHIRH